MTRDKPLSGCVVALTGAARGIGLEIARALVSHGARVAACDIDGEALGAAAEEVGLELHATLDVTDGAAFGAFLDEVEATLGPLGALVNNAGIMPTGPFLDEPDAVTERTLAINTLGMILGSRRALERMVPRRHGHVVNVSSTMGLVAVPGLATYNASKAATALFGETLALEFAPMGIAVTTILPGGVNTELAAGLDVTAAVPLPGGRKVNLVRALEPADVARAVVEALVRGESDPRLVLPRRLGLLLRMQDFMPLRTKRRMAVRMGVREQILGRTDVAQRKGYLDRATRS